MRIVKRLGENTELSTIDRDSTTERGSIHVGPSFVLASGKQGGLASLSQALPACSSSITASGVHTVTGSLSGSTAVGSDGMGMCGACDACSIAPVTPHQRVANSATPTTASPAVVTT